MRALVTLLIVASLRFAHQEVIDDILESLSKGVNFFEQQSRNMNLDGVVGYIILQGKPFFSHLLLFWKVIDVRY